MPDVGISKVSTEDKDDLQSIESTLSAVTSATRALPAQNPSRYIAHVQKIATLVRVGGNLNAPHLDAREFYIHTPL